MEDIELTILMPCLNEEKTIEICIKKAEKFLKENNINGEILIADNGSTDKSIEIAQKNNANIVHVKELGYGNAIRFGCKVAKGKYTIMGDSDDSYNFEELMPFLEKLREGNDLVIGNRYKGKMEKGAMKLSHKYIGTPIISFITKMKYSINIGDINCGLRGFDTKKFNDLNCKATGMEFATEMVIRFKEENLKIIEIGINFFKDGRNGKSHLRTVRDGMRHFKLIMKGNKNEK